MEQQVFTALKKYYGYTELRPGQGPQVQAILSGRDVLSIMPTGAGKSLCYQLPGILLPGITLVISPLISLMKDQVGALNQLGVRAAYLNSSLTAGQCKKALENARRGEYKIIYVAPERLMTDAFLSFARGADISLIAIDEAHCISQWGHDFRPSYTQIARFVALLPRRPVLAAFTATATQAVSGDILAQLKLCDPLHISTGFDRENLYFATVKTRRRKEFVLNYVQAHPEQSGIIYAATRKNVDELWAMLNASGIPAARYHAGLGDGERRQNQEDFLFDIKPVAVATSAFGMGIDKSNVSYVLHYNMPLNVEEYYQQAGRAGRDGGRAECILLYAATDVRLGRFMIDRSIEAAGALSGAEQEALREQAYEKLKQMTFYATSKRCLRGFLLSYFGQEHARTCGNCSCCTGKAEAYAPARGAKAIPPHDEGLFSALRAVRLEIAREENLPAYVIFHDATLKAMAAQKPRTLEALKRVRGVGELKLQKYGGAFIRAVNGFMEEHPF